MLPSSSWLGHQIFILGAGVRIPVVVPVYRSVAQSGSAPGLGPGGREFEPHHSDQLNEEIALPTTLFTVW